MAKEIGDVYRGRAAGRAALAQVAQYSIPAHGLQAQTHRVRCSARRRMQRADITPGIRYAPATRKGNKRETRKGNKRGPGFENRVRRAWTGLPARGGSPRRRGRGQGFGHLGRQHKAAMASSGRRRPGRRGLRAAWARRGTYRSEHGACGAARRVPRKSCSKSTHGKGRWQGSGIRRASGTIPHRRHVALACATAVAPSPAAPTTDFSTATTSSTGCLHQWSEDRG